MKIELKKIDDFSGIINFIREINTECTLTFTKNGISVRAIDPASVMMSRIEISKGLFDKYDVKEDVSFTINIEIMSKIIKSMKKGFIMEDADADFLFIAMDKKMKRSVKKFVSAKDDRTDPPISNVSGLEINLTEFLDAIDTSVEVGEIIELSMGDGFYVKCKGHLETYEVEVDKAKIEKLSKFLTTKFIQRLSCLSGTFKKALLKMDKDSSFYCECKNDNAEIRIWIAPRMEDQE